MIAAFNRLFDQTKPAFAQERTFERARTLAMSALVGLGRRTVSGMLYASAQQFSDWSAAYRIFERQRFDTNALFAPVRREVVERLKPEEPCASGGERSTAPAGSVILWGQHSARILSGGSAFFKSRRHYLIRHQLVWPGGYQSI
jgi:hypothetical protein